MISPALLLRLCHVRRIGPIVIGIGTQPLGFRIRRKAIDGIGVFNDILHCRRGIPGIVLIDKGKPLENHIVPGFRLILMPCKGSVFMERDRAGAVVIYGFLALDFAILIIDKVCFAGAGIRDGLRIGIQLTDDDPASQFPGAAAPVDGDPCLVIVKALYACMGPVTLVLSDEMHHGIHPVRVFLEHRNVFRAFIQKKRDLRLGGVVLAVLCPFYKEIADLRLGKESMHRGLSQSDIGGLCRELRIDLRCFLPLGIRDMAPSFNVGRNHNRCLRYIHRRKVIRLAALDFKLQAILPLFGNRDVEGLDRLIPRVQVAAQSISFLLDNPADRFAVRHQRDSPALITFRFGEVNDQRIAVSVFKGALPGPFFCFRPLGLCLAAGCQSKKHGGRQHHANQFFHI